MRNITKKKIVGSTQMRNKLPIIADPVEYLRTLKDAYESWPKCRRDQREPVKLLREIERVKGEIDERV